MNDFLKRTWAEIDLDSIKHNYNEIKKIVSDNVKVMCVVKADAYGHGVEFVAGEHDRLGADWFGVSNIEEAVQLRRNGINKPILILGYTPLERADELFELSLTQTVFDLEYAQELSEFACAKGIKVDTHIKIDTGMGRLGIVFHELERDREAVKTAEKICSLKGLNCKGIFTHFAVADEGEEGRAFTIRQFENFNKLIGLLEEKGISFEIKHCCNSAATIAYPEMHMDMVRPGIVLYGLLPSEKLSGKAGFKPAMALKTVISMLKIVDQGTSVSYGRVFISERETAVATVPIGYADGYPRTLSGKMDMLVNSCFAPIIGRVCMDQIMLDVTGIQDVKEGMTVTVFGTDKGVDLPVDRLAKQIGTINYEIVCLIGKRVPRIFYRSMERIGQINYICPESKMYE